MMVAWGKQSRAMAYMESLKSIVTSTTFSRSDSGITFSTFDTTEAFVPLTTAMIVPLRPWPALLERMVYTSSPIVVSSIDRHGPRFFAKSIHSFEWPFWSHTAKSLRKSL